MSRKTLVAVGVVVLAYALYRYYQRRNVKTHKSGSIEYEYETEGE